MTNEEIETEEEEEDFDYCYVCNNKMEDCVCEDEFEDEF